MERNVASRKQSEKEKRRAIIEWIITNVVVVVFFVVCLISIISTEATLAQKREELAAIEAATIAAENEYKELERILGDDDVQAYMEKMAIEELNYAYPNERRFYDTSRD